MAYRSRVLGTMTGRSSQRSKRGAIRSRFSGHPWAFSSMAVRRFCPAGFVHLNGSALSVLWVLINRFSFAFNSDTLVKTPRYKALRSN